jgi:hypothetical protein
MLDLKIALQTVVALTLSLVVLFVYLLGYTFWTRKKSKYWRIYEQKFRDHFFNLILDYAEQTKDHLTADEIIQKIGQRTKDYVFFLNLLEDLDEILDGTERERLDHFIEHQSFLSFYKKKLTANSIDNKIYACLYFQYTGLIDDRTLARLVVTSKSPDTKLAYAATKALQSAPKLITRKNALLQFFKRDDISELMVVELLHNFDSNSPAERPKIAQALKDILIKEIAIVAKSMIVRYLGHRQYYELSEFLFEYLKRLQYSKKKSILIRSLIIALGQLHEKKATPLISTYLAQQNIDIAVRLAAVKALSTIGKQQDLNSLIKFLLNAEFSIRKTIIFELAQDKDRIKLLDQFVIANLHYIQQLQKQNETSQQIKESVEKIKHVALGIKIALNHRLAKSYAK